MAWRYTYCYFKKQFFFLFAAIFFFSSSFAQTIFQSTDVPAVPLQNEGQAIQTGVKFRSAQNGYITGIRFYKGAGTAGSHIGQLWSAGGTLLASANFEGESSSGWQQVLFSDPFAITAGVTYVAACYSSSGDYAYTNSYFNSAVVNGPLRALANGEDGPNGVFILSQIPMFPTNTYLASNYWVDVVFSANIGPDVYPPVITSVSPYDGAVNVSLNTPIKAIFNEAMDVSVISNSTFELRNFLGAIIPATITYNSASNTATLTPSAALTHSSVYTAIVKGGSSGVKDIAGNAMPGDYTWTFTTTDPPFLPPTEGYGGPILVISDPANPFSRYTTEILRAEGLNEFAAKDISSVTSSDLAEYDVVILGEIPVSPQQVTMFTNWVNSGGTLVTFKPAASLNSLLGITPVNGMLADKYLLINTASGPGAGIVGQTIQYHGAANLYTLNGATSIATLYSDANTPTGNPAITIVNAGANGGKAIAFAYDLAKSIVYTRQGNPAWAGQKRDGQAGPIRSDDLFYPDWIDFNKVSIPQADEQQRLLANIILQSNLHRKPLPRLWYLPKGLKAAIVMTGDDHANNGTAGRFEHYLSLGPNTAQAVADWDTIRGTSYIYPNTPISNAQAASFEAQGFEIAMHPTTFCDNFTAASLENNISVQLTSFASNFPGLTSPVTNRTHCMPWSDWSTHPQVEFNHGMRMDMNYYYWPASWIQNRPGMFTGSGMPMRFAGINGSMIDCYQATTQMTDESGITIGNFCDELLNKATGPEGYYGAFVANMHTDSANHNGSDAVIASAMAHKVPVIAAKQLLRWTDGRNNTSFDFMSWNNDQLNFSMIVPSGAGNLNVMIPYRSQNGQLVSVILNGNMIPFRVETIKGMEYGFVNANAGRNTYLATYSSAIVVTSHPLSQMVCEGTTVTLTSSASGNPAP
ncbi:MAG TPA: DUF4082 domain-containing protein, partial [Chitinophagaceae bacterium]|nr:DUF4082 domain-containing protein [Chitinophagaceae bacterium]